MQIRVDRQTDRAWGKRLGVLLLASLLGGCGSDGDEQKATVAVQMPKPYAVPIAAPPARLPHQAPSSQWQQWTLPQPQAASGVDMPQARSPWQGPPVGFGRDMVQGQMAWPQPQPLPEAPRFRPWEEEQAEQEKKHQQQLGLALPMVAPYDRPLGSSRRGGQQYYVPGMAYPYVQPYGLGYGAYGQPGLGYGMPYERGPFGMGMWPFW